jgi:hypothetical protein
MMVYPDPFEALFVFSTFLFQASLIAHFALRKWRFELAMRYGWLVYALSIPIAILSMVLLLDGKNWYLWLGGFIYFTWGIYGYWIEYVKKIEWRDPIRWTIYGPYIFLYISTVMFFWWPLALIYKPLWYVYAILFTISTFLNITSHKRKLQLVH